MVREEGDVLLLLPGTREEINTILNEYRQQHPQVARVVKINEHQPEQCAFVDYCEGAGEIKQFHAVDYPKRTYGKNIFTFRVNERWRLL